MFRGKLKPIIRKILSLNIVNLGVQWKFRGVYFSELGTLEGWSILGEKWKIGQNRHPFFNSFINFSKTHFPISANKTPKICYMGQKIISKRVEGGGEKNDFLRKYTPHFSLPHWSTNKTFLQIKQLFKDFNSKLSCFSSFI